MISKINFKQPKYIFPLVVFIPLCALVYFVMQTFGGSEDAQQTVATDRINTELPQANAEEAGDKMYEMSRRFGDEDAFTAIGAIGEEQKENEELEHGYSEDELNKLDAAEAERLRQQREMEELERSLPSPEDTSIPLYTGTMLLAVQEPPVQVREAILPEHPKAIPRKMTSPVTWRKSNAEVTSARRPLKADWVSVALTGMSWLRNKGLIPSPKSVRPKRSAIVPNLSSNLVIPMRRSFIR